MLVVQRVFGAKRTNLHEKYDYPNNPEHEHIKTWIGRPFDASEFDIDEVNRRLTQTE
ncbi:MAG: plasmid pRiA4b ORF-3 family protein [Aquabacterium sp.]|nr:plasmid pRiA4b ORF-3 family protein [Aquabacterium sp.]